MIGVGDKVTLIPGEDWDAPPSVAVPRYGVVYTVRGAYIKPSGGVCLLFSELKNPHIRTPYGGERGFAIEEFRKVVSPKQFKTIETFIGDLNNQFGREPVA